MNNMNENELNGIQKSETPDNDSGATRRVLIRDLNIDEKPREKAATQGLSSLTDVELMALLLGSGLQGKSVLDLSRDILADNRNRLANLSRMSIAELKHKYKGVGTAKATLLAAAIEFGGRVQASLQQPDEQITDSRSAYNYMRPKLERLNYEEFWVLHLNRANRIIIPERISKGGMASTSVDVRLIAKSAIDHLSSALILVHNHPSGTLRPSPQDDNLTRRITETCKIIDVAVLDHIIVSPTGFYSYRDEGKMP